MTSNPEVTGPNCKVITTCFTGREVREETEITGYPPGPFMHCQNFPTPEKVLELVAYIYELERNVDPGVPMDTIIVNNDVSWEKGNKYLESIRNTKTFSGYLRVIDRENYGRSFGGYSAAFEQLRGQYRYWTFTEDDILVLGDQYFRICIDTFEKRSNIGFVAIQGLGYHPFIVNKKRTLHAHGGVGMTRSDILEKVYRKFGRLPHCGRNDSQRYYDIIWDGEVPFTNCIARMGYELVTVAAPSPLYTYAYNHMRGVDSTYPAASISEAGKLKIPVRQIINAEIRTDLRRVFFRLKRWAVRADKKRS